MMNSDLDNPNLTVEATRFLDLAGKTLGKKDFSLLSKLVMEWHSSPTLHELFSKWSPYKRTTTQSSFSFLHTLCFNVRGLDLRWHEVCLLAVTHRFDIMVLGEVGRWDSSTLSAALPNYRFFYQAGENPHGGILIFVRNGIVTSRVPCALPNVCALDLQLEEPLRIVALYAPASKSWQWSDLSSLTTSRCVLLGDFNVDLEKDEEKATHLLEFMDSCALAPFIPDTNTSLRSERTIDFALTRGVDISVQAYEGETTSDHKPLFCAVACVGKEMREYCRTIWPVFSLFLSYTFGFWENQWSLECYDETYDQFVSCLGLLAARCTSYFPRQIARPAIPQDLQVLLAQSRALSFKAKRKGDVKLRQEANQLRSIARFELKRFRQDQLMKDLKDRHKPGDGSKVFWDKTKRYFHAGAPSLRGFLLTNGKSETDPQTMADVAADYYEQLFEAPVVVRPHPYVDSPFPQWDNADVLIPEVSYPETLKILAKRKKKRSCDIHGLSPYLLDQMPHCYWHLLVRLYNFSFSTGFLPKKSKDVRMVLLAKKAALCAPDQTRPISLIDSFLKVQERLFLNRFLEVLVNRGILPDTQSGFRAGHRLQTRVLLLVE